MHVATLPYPEDIFGMIKIYLLLDPIPRLHRYLGLDMYREWKKTEFPKEYYI
jgi:hypothetical protein